jgi:hypothetical protein
MQFGDKVRALGSGLVMSRGRKWNRGFAEFNRKLDSVRRDK